jgi:hypothetical protein
MERFVAASILETAAAQASGDSYGLTEQDAGVPVTSLDLRRDWRQTNAATQQFSAN